MCSFAPTALTIDTCPRGRCRGTQLLAGVLQRELEQFLLGLDLNLTGDASPIPQPLRAVVSPLLSTVIRAVALAPDAIADAAESARRVATGE